MAEVRQSLPVKIDLEIDLRDVMLPGHRGYDEDGDPIPAPRSVEEALFEAAAISLANRVISDTEGRKAYHDSLRSRAKEILEEKLNERAAAMVEEALRKSFQPTNTFGQPQGDPITFEQYATEKIESWLQAPDATDRSMGGKRRTNLEGVVSNVIDNDFRKKLNAEVKKGRDQVLAELKDRTATAMSQSLHALAEGKNPR